MENLMRVLLLILFFITQVSFAQDQAPLQRDLMIIAELLPGTYDNVEQVYFDKRLKLESEKKHQRIHSEIRAFSNRHLGKHIFFVHDYFFGPGVYVPKILKLEIDENRQSIRMKTYSFKKEEYDKYKNTLSDPSLLKDLSLENLITDPQCDLFWIAIVHGYHATREDESCIVKNDDIQYYELKEMMLDDRSLWVTNNLEKINKPKSKNYYKSAFKLLRARWFNCSMTFSDKKNPEIISPIRLHDQGGEYFVKRPTEEKTQREIGIKLRNVDWAMNNTDSGFTNDVFVMYVVERNGNVETNLPYTWGAPEETSVGINLQWLLASCYIKPMSETRPYLRRKPTGPWESPYPEM